MKNTLASLLQKAGRDLIKSNVKSQKLLKKQLSISAKSLIAKEGRIPIPAKRKHEVRDKFKNKCAVKNCRGKPLQFHHKNAKNSDNKLNNLILLCEICHWFVHSNKNINNTPPNQPHQSCRNSCQNTEDYRFFYISRFPGP